ncbi:uncharacterized protein DUF3703 [Litorimonas taeanensis]|uniref:Uncharacterized protein DUF3703 n=1 Tax=Litorimonas taeanensis TaxID=568099 RepID=A0A420WEG4_9PROT|nr:DUF3703 domain-containing protein [Litorimonas taeanensis]RKQ69336.1 uncharacterized protein DUF3703 [Litorimonas taeanensis]
MQPILKAGFHSEMTAARQAYENHAWKTAFYHLERAHILGQRYFWPHLQTHLWMFRFGLKRRDVKEITGQSLRILAVFPAALFNWVPEGNTGGANISAIKTLPIPTDLQKLLDSE